MWEQPERNRSGLWSRTLFTIPSTHYATSQVSTTGTAAASGKFLGPKASVKQIPWQESELFAPDGPPGILVNPVLRLCHKEA